MSARLLQLQPVRNCLQGFLNDQDAARLLQTSSFIADALIADYAFADHIFAFDTAADVKRAVVFYTRYHMHILRMCLSEEWDEPLIDSETGLSKLPASLLTLTLGPDSTDKQFALAHPPSAESDRHAREMDRESEDGMAEFRRLIQLVDVGDYSSDSTAVWDQLLHEYSEGYFNQPITSGALPSGLHLLQSNKYFNQPFQVGSIPDTVTVLRFGGSFNQPLAVGHLPASIHELRFGKDYNQPLLAGVLPASLRRLCFGLSYDRLISPDILPLQLQLLSFGYYYNQPVLPGVIPPSVTHLRLGASFDQPLQPGTIPHGVVHLDLGNDFDQLLSPGALPSSLRELVISVCFNQTLQPGSLPDGLEVLAFRTSAVFEHVLQPDVIPTSVVVVSMGDQYHAELLAGSIPATVRWLRLPRWYVERDLSGVLSPSTRVVWWN